MDSLSQTIANIKSVKIQGATATAVTAIRALIDFGKLKGKDPNFFVSLAAAASQLKNARPTEPLLQNGLDFILITLKKNPRFSLLQIGEEFIQKIESARRQIITSGANLIKNDTNIVTHCHSSTVVALLKQAARLGKRFKVYATETRPLMQGQITAQELLQAGIDVTFIADSEAAHLIGPDDSITINLVLLGADSLGFDGSCANKVGSYGLALAAKQSDVPLYIAATLLKLDKRTLASGKIPIEERSPEEIWEEAPPGLKIANPAFDLIPAKFITGYISEFGFLTPGQIKDKALKNYPFLMETPQ